MSQSLTHTVTGATDSTGRYITGLLLDQGHAVQSITGHPERKNHSATGSHSICSTLTILSS